MPSPFTLTLETSFQCSWNTFGTLIRFGSVEIKALLEDYSATSEVGDRGGRSSTVRAEVTVLTADWVANGLKKGSVLTLETGKNVRIITEPFVPAEGRGTVDFSVTET